MLIVTFRVGAASYALRSGSVLAVIPEVKLQPLARGAAWLRGVFAYRGQLTPVVDLCQLIAGYRCPERLSSRIALVRCLPDGPEPRTLGVLAEHMTEARRLAAGLTTSPSLTDVPYFAELVLEQGEPLQFLDPTAILHASGLARGIVPSAPRISAGETHREPTES
jgi:chemotaxis-related protein WspB